MTLMFPGSLRMYYSANLDSNGRMTRSGSTGVGTEKQRQYFSRALDSSFEFMLIGKTLRGRFSFSDTEVKRALGRLVETLDRGAKVNNGSVEVSVRGERTFQGRSTIDIEFSRKGDAFVLGDSLSFNAEGSALVDVGLSVVI